MEILHRHTKKVLFSRNGISSMDTLVWLVNQAATSLSGADLSGADLSGENLSGMDLSGADFSGSDLSDVSATSANFSGADFTRTNILGADFRGAYLSGVNLREAKVEEIKQDMFQVLAMAPNEVANLKKAVIEGRIDGSTYQGDCACLNGTLSKSEEKEVVQYLFSLRDASRPIEKFFLGINIDDTPKNNPISELVLEWIEEFEQQGNKE